ncbi:MAG: hypothetical protein JWR15_3744 [Prosthecobacter sp.]|nr:hypothetical protein [Prosthecobacter sp.]
MTRTFRKLPPGTHWTLKAFELTAIRVASPVVCFWAPLIMVAVALRDWEMSMTQVIGVLVVAGAGCQMGAHLALTGVELPEATKGFKDRLRAAFLWPLSPRVQTILLMIWAGCYPLGWKTAAIAMGSLAFRCVWDTRVAVWLWKKLGYFRPAGESIRNLVERVSTRTGVSCRAVYETESTTANAYALTWSREVAITTGAVAALSEPEMEAVIAHELGHLNEAPSVRWTRLLGLIPSCLMVLVLPVMNSWDFFRGLLVIITAHIVEQELAKHSRRAEKAADAAAKSDEVLDGIYARALERIGEANLLPVVMSGKGTHPNLYDRMVAAGVQPDYPRPPAAESGPSWWTAWWLAVMTGLMFWGLTKDL